MPRDTSLRINLEENVTKELQKIQREIDKLREAVQSVSAETSEEDFVEFAETVQSTAKSTADDISEANKQISESNTQVDRDDEQIAKNQRSRSRRRVKNLTDELNNIQKAYKNHQAEIARLEEQEPAIRRRAERISKLSDISEQDRERLFARAGARQIAEQRALHLPITDEEETRRIEEFVRNQRELYQKNLDIVNDYNDKRAAAAKRNDDLLEQQKRTEEQLQQSREDLNQAEEVLSRKQEQRSRQDEQRVTRSIQERERETSAIVKASEKSQAVLNQITRAQENHQKKISEIREKYGFGSDEAIQKEADLNEKAQRQIFDLQTRYADSLIALDNKVVDEGIKNVNRLRDAREANNKRQSDFQNKHNSLRTKFFSQEAKRLNDVNNAEEKRRQTISRVINDLEKLGQRYPDQGISGIRDGIREAINSSKELRTELGKGITNLEGLSQKALDTLVTGINKGIQDTIKNNEALRKQTQQFDKDFTAAEKERANAQLKGLDDYDRAIEEVFGKQKTFAQEFAAAEREASNQKREQVNLGKELKSQQKQAAIDAERNAKTIEAIREKEIADDERFREQQRVNAEKLRDSIDKQAQQGARQTIRNLQDESKAQEKLAAQNRRALEDAFTFRKNLRRQEAAERAKVERDELKAQNELAAQNRRALEDAITFRKNLRRQEAAESAKAAKELQAQVRQVEREFNRATRQIEIGLLEVFFSLHSVIKPLEQITGYLIEFVGANIQASTEVEKFSSTLVAVAGSAFTASRQLDRLFEITIDLSAIDTPSLIQFSSRLQNAGLTAKQAENTIVAVTKRMEEQGKAAAVTNRVLEQFVQAINANVITLHDFRPILREYPGLYGDFSQALGETITSIDDLRGAAERAGGATPAIVRTLDFVSQIATGAEFNTVNKQLNELTDRIFNLRRAFGDVLQPAVLSILKLANRFVGTLSDMNDGFKIVIGTMSVLTIAFGKLFQVVFQASVAAIAISQLVIAINQIKNATAVLQGLNLTLGGTQVALGGLSPVVKNAGRVISIFSKGLLAASAGFGALLVIIPAIILIYRELTKHTRLAREEHQAFLTTVHGTARAVAAGDFAIKQQINSLREYNLELQKTRDELQKTVDALEIRFRRNVERLTRRSGRRGPANIEERTQARLAQTPEFQRLQTLKENIQSVTETSKDLDIVLKRNQESLSAVRRIMARVSVELIKASKAGDTDAIRRLTIDYQTYIRVLNQLHRELNNPVAKAVQNHRKRLIELDFQIRKLESSFSGITEEDLVNEFSLVNLTPIIKARDELIGKLNEEYEIQKLLLEQELKSTQAAEDKAKIENDLYRLRLTLAYDVAKQVTAAEEIILAAYELSAKRRQEIIGRERRLREELAEREAEDFRLDEVAKTTRELLVLGSRIRQVQDDFSSITTDISQFVDPFGDIDKQRESIEFLNQRRDILLDLFRLERDLRTKNAENAKLTEQDLLTERLRIRIAFDDKVKQLADDTEKAITEIEAANVQQRQGRITQYINFLLEAAKAREEAFRLQDISTYNRELIVLQSTLRSLQGEFSDIDINAESFTDELGSVDRNRVNEIIANITRVADARENILERLRTAEINLARLSTATELERNQDIFKINQEFSEAIVALHQQTQKQVDDLRQGVRTAEAAQQSELAGRIQAESQRIIGENNRIIKNFSRGITGAITDFIFEGNVGFEEFFRSFAKSSFQIILRARLNVEIQKRFSDELTAHQISNIQKVAAAQAAQGATSASFTGAGLAGLSPVAGFATSGIGTVALIGLALAPFLISAIRDGFSDTKVEVDGRQIGKVTSRSFNRLQRSGEIRF